MPASLVRLAGRHHRPEEGGGAQRGPCRSQEKLISDVGSMVGQHAFQALHRGPVARCAGRLRGAGQLGGQLAATIPPGRPQIDGVADDRYLIVLAFGPGSLEANIDGGLVG